MKNRELKAILLRSGFVHMRSRGDHHVWKHPVRSRRPIVLAGDDGTEVPIRILKQVRGQLSEEERSL